ncbi:MAG: CTP synthase [Clostridiales bacterium]|nr:CTP synthase [Clostridiales bacterium]
MSKFVFVTGGVVSGLGKGITAASLAMLIKSQGYTVDIVKFDPYFNVDSLYLSPYQHGEVFVTDDGGEGDLVLGHYERFLDQDLTENSNITSGKIYLSVINREREGGYDGESVQVVPHITDEIKRTLYRLDKPETDVVVCEIGGVVGDIENHPYLEAIRQCRGELGKGNALYIHVTYVPLIEMSGEHKTKPTQNSVKELQNIGIQPDIIVCRSDYPLDESAKKKLSMFCNVERSCIIESITTNNLYMVPIKLQEQNFSGIALKKLKLEERESNLAEWESMCKKAEKAEKAENKLKIAIVGKYTERATAYRSITDAVTTAGLLKNIAVDITLVPSAEMEENAEKLSGYDGIIIAPGFGVRGFEGKVAACKYARENDIPCLMIGLGAEAGVVEYARNVCTMVGAHSQEFDEDNPYPVVCYTEPRMLKKGSFPTMITAGTHLSKIYGVPSVKERHRHRFDINAKFEQMLLKNGMVFSAHSPTGVPEAFEVPTDKFYIGTVYNPEYRSRLLSTHPLFAEFIKVISREKDAQKTE